MSEVIQAVHQFLLDVDIRAYILSSVTAGGDYCSVYSESKRIVVYYIDGVVRVQIWGNKRIKNSGSRPVECYTYIDGCDFDIQLPDCFDRTVEFLRRFYG